MKILVLGANGFIGSEVARTLARHGHVVTGLARRLPAHDGGIAWLAADMARLTKPAAWTPLIAGFDAVVNCAGALQSGARDDVTVLQQISVGALVDAAAATKVRLLVNVSAPLDGSAAATEFLATKREADGRLKRSGVPFVILRPALVVGRNAHGGSALLRALAAFPVVTPLAFPDSPIRVAGLGDVCAAVADAVSGKIPPGTDAFIAAPESIGLARIVALHRAWLGLPPARTIAMPAWVARLSGRFADFLGALGWRSPMRSTAMAVSAGGVETGEGIVSAGLPEILAANPAGVQDLWFARLYLAKPLVFGVLSLFWMVSGLIALARFDATAALAREAGLSGTLANATTLATALADIAIGVGIAVRRYSRVALVASLAFSFAYLAFATVLTPALWLDPLGVLVKVFPAAMLSVVALAIFEERA